MPSATATRSRSRRFLLTHPASRVEARFALAAMGCFAALFLALLPFVRMPLSAVSAFIPTYEVALLTCDLITAALLFSQFRALGSLPLLALASGYVFTGLVTFAHALTFPGAFAAGGLLGAGPQSTAWLYMFWHGGFPAFVIAYALLRGRGADRLSLLAVACLAAVLVLAGTFTLVATVGGESLPVLVAHGRFTRANLTVISIVVLLCCIAVAVLWRQRPHTALDLWLLVVLCALAFEMVLAGIFTTGRFDVGWYAGRLYGLFAGSLLLLMLVFESGAHFRRLARLSTQLTEANTALEALSLHDALTSLANRRYFDAYLAEQVAVAHRHNRVLALVLCDVDHFKAYNGRHGHQAGDECLKQVALALRSCCRRPADMAARYGGEEFALILPDTDHAGAALVAEAARAAIASLRLPGAHSPPGEVTISGGIAALIPGDTTKARDLIRGADQALFEAKRLGRDRMLGCEELAA